jgi:hypothetical protein
MRQRRKCKAEGKREVEEEAQGRGGSMRRCEVEEEAQGGGV